MSETMNQLSDCLYHVGDTLKIEGERYLITGRIKYKDKEDNSVWDEYQLEQRGSRSMTKWLSVDDGNFILWESCQEKDLNEEWELLESGTEEVTESYNDVDVDPSDSAAYSEYVNKSTGEYYSIEIWDDETEHSSGRKIDGQAIDCRQGNKKEKKKGSSIKSTLFYCAIALGLLIFFKSPSGCNKDKKVDAPSIESIMKGGSQFESETYITGADKQYATIYKYYNPTIAVADDDEDEYSTTSDEVAKYIINNRYGETSHIQQDAKDTTNIFILTDKECCLIYHPVDEQQNKKNETYIHVASREWTLKNLNSPLYQADSLTQKFYLDTYESYAFVADSTANPSEGRHHHRHCHVLPLFGRYNDYSNSVRETSHIRRASGGGHGGGGK